MAARQTNKKFSVLFLKKEPQDPDDCKANSGGNAITLPEVHIKAEQPDWDMGESSTEPDPAQYLEEGTSYDEFDVNNIDVVDSNGSIKYADLKKDLKQFIETTVESAVDRCFQKHFARLVELITANKKPTVADKPTGFVEPPIIPEKGKAPSIMHKRIEEENDLYEWNARLENEACFETYVDHFMYLVPPNSHVGRGDTACYLIVDRLFTRPFWNSFSWTGHGQQTDRGFREFGNVLKLLLRLISIGDPTYTKASLEMFCRCRLFRSNKTPQTKTVTSAPSIKVNESNTKKVPINEVENHEKINNEYEVEAWNVKLRDEQFFNKYVRHFEKIIVPNSYVEIGDNAGYMIVDCLFTREFWVRLTWSGVKRSKLTKGAFCVFTNVLRLLNRLIMIGDPTYDEKKLEMFVRRRLFRYSKERCLHKKVRKSTIRPGRVTKKKIEPGANDDILVDST